MKKFSKMKKQIAENQYITIFAFVKSFPKWKRTGYLFSKM